MNECVAAVILAGGHSRRMGRPKALLPIDGKALIEHLIERCRAEVDTVLVAGCPQPGLYSRLPVPVLEDVLGDMGPLGGLYTAMRYCRVNRPHIDTLWFMPCDGLQWPAGFFQRLLNATSQHELVFARDARREQHLYGMLRCTVQDDLLKYLNGGGRKVIDWFHSRDYAVVDFDQDDFCFANFNTPDDWNAHRP